MRKTNHILASFDNLVKSLNSYRNSLPNNFDDGGLKIAFAEKDQVDMMIDQVKTLRREWLGALPDLSQYDSAKNIPVDSDVQFLARTYWQVVNGSIKITCQNPQKYEQIISFPVSLFSEIAECAIAIAKKEGFIKNSIILSKMKHAIVKQSNYKKYPRVVIVFAMKVLVELGVFEVRGSRSLTKYCLLGDKKQQEVLLSLES